MLSGKLSVEPLGLGAGGDSLSLDESESRLNELLLLELDELLLDDELLDEELLLLDELLELDELLLDELELDELELDELELDGLLLDGLPSLDEPLPDELLLDSSSWHLNPKTFALACAQDDPEPSLLLELELLGESSLSEPCGE